jgi:flagellar basal-body rod protein FlgB
MPVMSMGDIPLLGMLKSRLGYLADRQRVVAENVANADTPGYKAHDLKPFSFQVQMQAASSSAAAAPTGSMAVTNPAHIQPKAASHGLAKTVKSRDSEETLDGNGVVLEDEMIKLTDARMDYEAAIGFYQQSVSMLKMAVRKPGGG